MSSKLLALLTVAIVGLVGCGKYTIIAEGPQGQAWVLRQGMFNQTVYNCVAGDDKVDCYKVDKRL